MRPLTRPSRGEAWPTVDVYVGHQRKKIGEDRIETVRGAGYRFVGDA